MKVAWLAVAGCLLLAAPAHGVPEEDAAALRVEESGRSDVLGVWHEPTVVQPRSQWVGHIQFTPDHNVSEVLYQICRVGTYCFAPPTAADRVNETTWRFDTSDYLQPGSGKPVQYEAGWRVGYQFLLEENNQTTFFPEGHDAADPACAGDAWMACAEGHYFAFNVAGSPDQGAPGPSPLMTLVVVGSVALLAAARRNG